MMQAKRQDAVAAMNYAGMLSTLSAAKTINRRQFCRILAGGALIAGVGGLISAARAASPYGRPKSDHILGHLPPELQPVQVNPNLPTGISQQQSFQRFIEHWQVPGILYKVGEKPVRAVAPGIVHFFGEKKDRNRRFKGYYVRVAHDMFDGLREQYYPRVTLYRNQAYRSTYYYLSKVNVRQWESIKRGQIIGYGGPYGTAGENVLKLVVEERGNPVNPDNYGRQQGFMLNRNMARAKERTLEQMNRRLDDQHALVRAFNDAFNWKHQSQLFKHIHCFTETEKFYDYPVKWSTVEQFRFLASLFRKDPRQFGKLTEKQFNRMSKQFRSLQPIELTLPFD